MEPPVCSCRDTLNFQFIISDFFSPAIIKTAKAGDTPAFVECLVPFFFY
jgi:hypothetical protein